MGLSTETRIGIRIRGGEQKVVARKQDVVQRRKERRIDVALEAASVSS
jgi:hypothetical protein